MKQNKIKFYEMQENKKKFNKMKKEIKCSKI